MKFLLGWIPLGVGLARKAQVIIKAEVIALFYEIVLQVKDIVLYLGLQLAVLLAQTSDQTYLSNLEDIVPFNRTNLFATFNEKQKITIEYSESAHES